MPGRRVDLEKLSLEELLDLEKRVKARIRELGEAKAPAESFKPGDRVGFLAEGHSIEGVVTEAKADSLTVQAAHTHWSIHPRMAVKLASEGRRR